MTKEILKSKNYLQTFEQIKRQITSSQIKAQLSVNKEMLIAYWQIGKIIIEQRELQKWGSKVIEQLASDLKGEFPDMKGLSATNLKYMAIFAENYSDLLMIRQQKQIGQQPIDQLEKEYFINERLSIFVNIPWGHNVDIFTKLKDTNQRIWYANKTIENGWSRNSLSIYIASNLYDRQSKNELKTNNFAITLPQSTSDLANDILKDNYNFEFIANGRERLSERELEKSLTDHIIKFLTELGQGFAFVGRQYKVSTLSKDYYIDLLFYHLKLRSYIVIELKTTEFEPEYAGKMAFYLMQVDKNLRTKGDNDSIGIILCPKSSDLGAQETINYITKPMGVAGYQLAEDTAELPKELKPLEEIQNLITNKEKNEK